MVTGAFSALVALVTDQYTNPLPDVSVSFAAPPGTGPSAALSGAPAVTDNNGLASISATANTHAGTYMVTASVPNVMTPASFSLTNTPGPAASLTVSSGSGQSATIGARFSSPLVVLVTDQYTNPVQGVNVTFTAPSPGASAALSGSSVITDNNGLASVMATANATFGTYMVSAIATGVATPASFSLTNNGALASISGYVFDDANNDGIKETGEAGIPGVTVILTGSNDQGTITPIQVTTGTDGSYSFGNLRPGTYTVTEVTDNQLAGYLDGRDTVGTVGGTPDGTPTNGSLSQVVLGFNQNGVNYNFGEVSLNSSSQHSLISSNFNGTAIAAGNTIWFNSVFTASGLSTTHPVTIRLVDQEIKFTAGSTAYDLLVPNAIVIFSPATKTATTMFDTTTQTWITNVPSTGLSGNVFLSGVGFAVPGGGLPGGIKSVTWEGDFLTDTPGVSIQNWKWAAAVYGNTKAPTPFPSGFYVDYGTIGVKPVDDPKASLYQNSDHAGTPENDKPYVIGGATGGGGANYTGGLSGSASVTAPLVIPNLGVLDPTASYDLASWLLKKPKKS
jgi:hypothetical protein